MRELQVPVPRVGLAVRAGTMADVPFMDALQKKHSGALGWFPAGQFAGYVEQGGVLVAEVRSDECGVMNGRDAADGVRHSSLITPHSSLPPSLPPRPVGYVISRDRYAGRDDLGAVYQLAVEAGARRRLVGAALVRAVFERAAWGCRLFCCWCAQDLPANHFWESVGFVPIAFRTGSRGKRRTHILWQRRVRSGDDHPYWYPFQTKGGAIREDRLVFPIPPGTHWSEAKPVILPGECQKPAELAATERKQLEDKRAARRVAKRAAAAEAARPPERNAAGQIVVPGKVAMLVGGRVRYVDRPGQRPAAAAPPVMAESEEKPKRAPRPAQKHERAALAFCRELRDRWQERVAEEPGLLADARGKWDVSRLPGGGSGTGALQGTHVRALPAAA